MQNVHFRLRAQIRNLGNRLVRQIGPRCVRGRRGGAGRRPGARNGRRPAMVQAVIARRAGTTRDSSRNSTESRSPPDVVPRND